MSLPRKACPVETRCRIAMRQLGEIFPDTVIDVHKEQRISLTVLLHSKLDQLAELLGCESRHDLRRDHEPALARREKMILLPNGRKVRTVVVPEGGEVLRYFPDENDPDFQLYRTKVAHDLKTNVRGDGAQYPDRVLIKRDRRRARGPRPKAKIKGLTFQQQNCRMGARCSCDRRTRKKCVNFRRKR